MSDEEWMDDYEKGFLKLTDGQHKIVVLDSPRREQSKFSGDDQWVFDVVIDGAPGFIAPGKRLGKLFARAVKLNEGKYPATFEVIKAGEGINTEFRLVE